MPTPQQIIEAINRDLDSEISKQKRTLDEIKDIGTECHPHTPAIIQGTIGGLELAKDTITKTQKDLGIS